MAQFRKKIFSTQFENLCEPSSGNRDPVPVVSAAPCYSAGNFSRDWGGGGKIPILYRPLFFSTRPSFRSI